VISRTGLALLVFVGLAGAFPSAVNWGAHFWGFLPFPVPIVLGILMASALLPVAQDSVLAFLQRCVVLLSTPTRLRSILLWVILSAAAGVLFWTFRERTFFLGDGYLILRTLPVAVTSGDIPGSFPTAPLTGLLASFLFQAFRWGGTADPALAAWQALSILSGMAAIPVVWNLTRPLAADGRERLALSALIGGGGAAMLFFGYVETYAPAYVTLLAFIAAAQNVREGHGSLITVSLLFVALVFLHVGMALFTPVMILLYVKALSEKRWNELALPVLCAVVAAALILLLLSYSPARLLATFLRDGGSFLPLRGTDGWNESYTLFSLWHWVDLLNLHLLVSPFALVLAGGLFVGALVPARYRQPGTFFWIVVAGPPLLWLFFNNFELGLSRDWDLAAPFAAVIGLGGLAGWLAMMGPSETRTRGVVVMALITLVHTAGWVGVNARVEGSLLRFDTLLDFRAISPRAMAIAYEEVGDYRRERRDVSGAVEAFARMVVLDSTNARRWTVFANAEAIAGNAPGARIAYEKAIALGSVDPEAHTNLAIVLFAGGDVDAALDRIRAAVALDTLDATAAYTYGQMLFEGKRDMRGALPWFERALRLDPNDHHAQSYADRCRAALGGSSSQPPGGPSQ
jgi:hypothetical protein